MYNQGGYNPHGGGGGYPPRQLPPHLNGPPPNQYHQGPPPPQGPRQHGNYPPVSQPDFSRPPPGYNGPPMGPPSGGPSMYPNRPPPNFRGAQGLPPTPQAMPEQKKELSAQTTLFVGGIAPGVTDPVLEQLLNACGPLRMLKRVSGATGKPQGFGFAEYQDPDSVLRALAVLNGVEIPDLSDRSNPGKKLIVKADDNTRKFLDEYESQMSRTDADDQLELAAIKSITAILEALNNGTALPTSSSTALASSSGTAAVTAPDIDIYAVPEHLKDLDGSDLPEDNRDAVLNQIASFRVNSVEAQQAKKAREAENERRRVDAMVAEQHAQRLREQQAAQRQKEMMTEKEREKDRLAGSSGGRGGAFGDGPQGWSKPVGFVAASGSGTQRTDEQEEQLRQERRRRDAADSLRERERRIEARERSRLQGIDREYAQERQREIEEKRDFHAMKDKLARFDDDEQEEKGRDLWYTERSRWRSQRLPVRRREEDADEADRRAEVEENAALERESEEFLAQQLKDMDELAIKQKAAGILTDDIAPIKLNIVAKPAPAPAPAVSESKVVGEGKVFVEEEEEETKKKRVLVKLDYGDGLTVEERELKRVQGLAKIKLEKVPKTADALFKVPVKWEAINETIIEKKLQPLVRRKLFESLGEMDDDDLLKFVIGHIRERKSAADLVEGLEPILEDEATPFTSSIWRAVVFESLASAEGLDSRDMVVE